MDLSKRIIYNEFTAAGLTTTTSGAPGYGTVVNKIDVSDLDVSQYFDKRAVQDGIDAADVYLGARRINIDASIFGSTRGHAFDQLYAFTEAFHPVIAYNADTANIGFLQLEYYRPTADISTWPTSTYPDGIPLFFYARPLAPPRFIIDRQETGGTAGKSFSIRVAATLVARDPRAYRSAAIVASISTDATTATYRGNFPTWPIITFAMSAAGSSAQLFTVGGGSVKLNLSTTTTGTYRITFADRTIEDANNALATSLFDTTYAQSFRQLQSGSTYYANELTGMSSCTITYREAFTI